LIVKTIKRLFRFLGSLFIVASTLKALIIPLNPKLQIRNYKSEITIPENIISMKPLFVIFVYGIKKQFIVIEIKGRE